MDPSLLDVISYQLMVEPMDVSSVHVAPESLDVQMLPYSTNAASLDPSLLEVIPIHLAEPADVSSVHVAPESLDVQMLPW